MYTQTVYAALDDHVLVAEGDPDDDWTATEHLDGYSLRCLDAAPAAPDRAFAGTFESGLHRTRDGGESWERVGSDLPDAVMSVTVSLHDPRTVYAGTEPSRVFVSRDAGDTWQELPDPTDLPSASEWYFPPRPDTHHVRWIEIDPADPDRLYVGIEAGALVRSADGGDTWQDRPASARRDNHSLATHPDAPGRVYAAAGDGYAESDDRGDTWDHPQVGLDHRYCWSVRPDPGDPDAVVLSAASGARTAHDPDTAESYVYRRRGSDAEWQTAMDGLPGPDGLARAILDTAGPGEFYALTNRGLHHSADTGASWHEVALDWSEDYREEVPRGLAVV
jgi:hypothetical protein